MYGRRGFLVTFEEGGTFGGSKQMPLQWLLYYTNQRVVGLRDPKASEVEDIGALRPFERQDYAGGGPGVLEYFALDLEEVKRAERRRRDVRLVVSDASGSNILSFEPLGGAARFFARLVSEKAEE